MKIKLGSLIGLHCANAGVGHTFVSLNLAMRGNDLASTIVAPSCDPTLRDKDFIEAVPQPVRGACYRIPFASSYLAERRFLNLLNTFDAAYLFPGCSQRLLKSISKRNVLTFAERINCHTGTAKTILDDAYTRIGLRPAHRITSAAVERETEDMKIADYIFCPSPEVRRSYEKVGITPGKLIETSYGWDPSRFPHRHIRKPSDRSGKIVVLFVGHLSIRKGTHLLLGAWEKANIDGKLLLYGNMEEAIRQTCSRALSRSDVLWASYTTDVSRIYRDADVFAFPSLEEGSPLVTYEAMAHGLPMLVSPMAAGGIVRDGIDGIVIPPYGEEQWVDALQKLSDDSELRTYYGESSRQRADMFTWNKVGRQRALEIVRRTPH
jgi:glycosyltransferase involved in cell wall biosynthesis